MTEDHTTNLRNARRYILSWQFLTLVTSIILSWMTMSMSIGTATHMVRSDILQMIFVSIISGVTVLGILFFIVLDNFKNDHKAWMFPLILSSVTIGGVSAVIYRHHEVLRALSDMQMFGHIMCSMLIIFGMTAFVKISLRMILGKSYTA